MPPIRIRARPTRGSGFRSRLLPRTYQAHDAEDDADEAHVQAHVAVENVTELMGDHALQFVAIEQPDAAPRHADGGIVGGVTGRERIDARFPAQQVHRRHLHAGGQCHFLDHIQQLAFIRVRGVGVEQFAAEHLGDRAAAPGQLGGFGEAADDDHRQRAQGDPEQDLRVPRMVAAEQQDEHRIDREDQSHHGQHEVGHELRGAAPGLVLSFKEIHCRFSIAKCQFTCCRTPSCGRRR